MALTNCTINSTNVTVTASQAVGSTANQVLTISPDDGFVVAAENFSAQSPPTGIDTITLSDSTTAYADDNKVLVTCDLTNTYNPGAANVTLTIDIDGEATDKKIRPYTYAGTWSQAATDFNPQPINANGPHSYSGSLLEGEEVVIFEQTYTASANNTMTAPTVAFGNSSYAGDYTVITENTAMSDFGPTAMKITCKYKSPAANASGHTITVTKGTMTNFPTTTNLITGVIIDDSSLSPAGETRDLKVYGTPGASFRLFIRKEGATDADDTYYGFPTDPTTGVTNFSSSSSSYSSNYTIPSTGTGAGVYVLRIFFDDINLQNPQSYFISVIGGTSPATNTTQGSSDNNDAFEITLTGANDVTVTTTATSSAGLTAAYVNNVATANASDDLYDSFGNLAGAIGLKMTVTHSSGKALYKRREPVFSDVVAYNANNSTTINLETMNDFTNTVPSDINVDTAFEISGLSITSTDGATSLVIESGSEGYGISQAGPSSVTSVLNLDNFINQQPTANSASVNADYETAQAITLTGNDPEGDTLTFSTTVDPSNGSLSGLNSSTGAITYTPNSSFSGSDSFKFKVNDGIEDSSAATVTVTVAGSGGGGTPSGGRWNIDIYNSSGYYSGSHFVSSDNYCDGSSLAVMPGGAASCFSVGSWVRYATVAGGCGTSYGRAKITSHSTSDGVPTAYLYQFRIYPSREDSHNSTNATVC